MANIASEFLAIDHGIVMWTNQLMHKWPMFDQTVQWISNAYVVKFVPMVLVLCWFWFEKNRDQRENRIKVLEALISCFSALLLGRLLALTLPFRDRPFVNAALHLDVPIPTGMRTWSSFPSDHTVLAFALVIALWRLSPRIGYWAFFHAVVFICLPRLYLGFHYPSDLIGGGLLGVVLALAVFQLNARLAATDLLLKMEHRWAGYFYAFGFFVLFEIGEMFDSARALARYVFQALRLLVS